MLHPQLATVAFHVLLRQSVKDLPQYVLPCMLG